MRADFAAQSLHNFIFTMQVGNPVSKNLNIQAEASGTRGAAPCLSRAMLAPPEVGVRKSFFLRSAEEASSAPSLFGGGEGGGWPTHKLSFGSRCRTRSPLMGRRLRVFFFGGSRLCLMTTRSDLHFLVWFPRFPARKFWSLWCLVLFLVFVFLLPRSAMSLYRLESFADIICPAEPVPIASGIIRSGGLRTNGMFCSYVRSILFPGVHYRFQVTKSWWRATLCRETDAQRVISPLSSAISWRSLA